MDTPESYVYTEPLLSELYQWYELQPDQTITGDGDGTVNIRSLLGCNKWKNVKQYAFPGADHLGMLANVTVIARIQSIIQKLQAQP